MSEKAYAALELIRKAALESQVDCAWCEKVCKNADHLFIHILLRHPEVRKA